MEKCIERIQLHLPESLYQDVLAEAAERDLAASAFIRNVLERHLYGNRRRVQDSNRSARERRE